MIYAKLDKFKKRVAWFKLKEAVRISKSIDSGCNLINQNLLIEAFNLLQVNRIVNRIVKKRKAKVFDGFKKVIKIQVK